MTKAESKALKQALNTAMYPNETKLVVKALNAEINGTLDFYSSKASHELKSIVKAANIALANEKLLNACARAFKKTTPEINKLLNGAVIDATKALNKLGIKKLAKVKAKPVLKEPEGAPRALLQKALKDAGKNQLNSYIGRSIDEWNEIIALASAVLMSEKEQAFYSKQLEKSVPEIKELLNKTIRDSEQILEKKYAQQVEVPVQGEAGGKELSLADRTILKRALNNAINSNRNFYTTKTDNELATIIRSANDAATNASDLDFFSKELQRTVPEIQELINKATRDAERILGKQHGRPVEIGRQEGLVPVAAVQKAAVQKMAPRNLQPEPKKGGDNYSFYIMLDVQDVNAKGQPIRWQESIDLVAAKLDDAQFIPTDYHHITLAWHVAKQSLRPDMIAKIEKALARANEILKIFYPKGARGISLKDGAYLSQGGGVSFRVAKSVDLENIQATLAQFLRFEGIDLFHFNTFENKMPFHVTLGVIKPFNETRQIKDEVEHLDAPAGTRAYRDEDIVVDKFRATQALPHAPYQQVGAYAF
jgi:hypothetical protein